MEQIFDWKKYAALARKAAAEGIVLLKNDDHALPLKTGTKISVFGRSQFHYYKSGTGSGGLVNTGYVVGILDALKASEDILLNETVLGAYEEWLKDHPFDNGAGWALEPWCQEEMVPDRLLVEQAAAESDAAVIVLGRTAGEDKDNSAQEGSYLLNAEEKQLLEMVCDCFSRTIVLLNVGNIIDMKWVKEYDPSAVLYVWQGGQEGGNAVLDILTGAVNPSGKLTDTVSYDIADYPSTANFGNEDRNLYAEDIYLGYRYFETFAKDKVLYPFGFGLSYTDFALHTDCFERDEDQVTVRVSVTNTGSVSGKEALQLYCEAPQGALGKPARVLCGFVKTGLLAPGQTQVLTISCKEYDFSSYDDSGLSGHRFCYVLEKGEYRFYAGSDVRSASLAGSFCLADTKVVEQLSQAMAPVTAFDRLRPDSDMQPSLEKTPLREYSLCERIRDRKPACIPYTGDLGWKLKDVAQGKVSLESFVGQLTDQQMCTLLRGEGMCSPKVTPGTAGAFGGVTPDHTAFGIPVACCSDGPSGIRMDCGTTAFSMPNGTCLACTFNEELSTQLFEMTGLELRKNKIDTLLGPGINLHRNPMNGRNFEYFSEDPFLTGKMASAQLKGMQKYKVTGTIKHFACNNQEFHRNDVDAVVSERALRELYLKAFEIAVKEGGAYCIMSSYNPINGLWAASNYDMQTTILRGEWGYQGIVMTDWWAKGNREGEDGSRQNFAAMVRSQNDLYMVTSDSASNSNQDNLEKALTEGWLLREELQRCAMNMCRVLMKTPAFTRIQGIEDKLDEQLSQCAAAEDVSAENMINVSMEREALLPADLSLTRKGESYVFQVFTKFKAMYRLSLRIRSTSANALAQLPVSVYKDSVLLQTISLTGMDKEWKTYTIDLGGVINPVFYLKLFFGQGELQLADCKITLVQEFKTV